MSKITDFSILIMEYIFLWQKPQSQLTGCIKMWKWAMDKQQLKELKMQQKVTKNQRAT